jgi:HEAT repeat protein
MLALAIPVTLLLFPNPELRYKGHTLEYWIEVNSRSPDAPEAPEAILAITTNSVPLLLQRLSADTSWEERLEAKLPAFLRTDPTTRRFLSRQRYRAACSLRAFAIAGTNAACAIPAVTQLLSDHNRLVVKLDALRILSAIGPAALPGIRQGMRNPDARVRSFAIGLLWRLGTNAAPAIPDLVAACSDPHPGVRGTASNVLETLAHEALQTH